MKKGATAPSAPSKTSAWVTTSTARPKSGPAKSATAQKNKTGGKGSGGVFAAMMMDSDSD